MRVSNRSKTPLLHKLRPLLQSSTQAQYAIYLVPGLSLLAFILGGEIALLVVALALPLAAGLIAVLSDPFLALSKPGGAAKLMGADLFNRIVKNELETCRSEGSKTAVIMLKIDDFAEIVDRYGQTAADSVIAQAASRIKSSLRSNDLIGAHESDGFAVFLAPQPSLDLEICLQLAGRLSLSIEEPFSVDGVRIYASSSIGFCQLGRETARSNAKNTSDADDRDPVVICANIALDAALAVAPSAIRAFAPDMRSRTTDVHSTEKTVVDALENGEIVPWFQPQISTDTGLITGFECLARWIDPCRGPISPAEFLPQLEAANKMGRLLEVILYHALTATKAWDQAGLDIQQIGVNFSSAELSDPALVDKVSWELDRFELSPDRLAVEILETVVAHGPDDVITRNIKGLSELGCRIDLDDFGTGHASLGSIRRFGVGRIKIDRSFVMKADRDPEQQRMIRAILTMAERLDLETLAEGVETVGEHALLAQLGCTHVQGFGVGRPMPFEQTMTWIREHNQKLQAPPQIGRSAG